MSRRDRILGINRRNLDLVFADYRPGQFRELDDKVAGKVRLERAGVAVPPTIGVVRGGRDLERLDGWLADRDEVVLKPARGWGGRGILVLGRGEDGAWRTPGGRTLDDHAVRGHVEEILTGAFSLDESEDQALLEERIHAHPFLEALYPHGLADLRVVLEDGAPVQAMLRVPTDASDGKANLHGGGLGLGIDLQTGRIVRAVQHDRDVAKHPDTGRELVGLTVPDWPACLEVARAAAAAVAPIRYLGVDIVLDARRGPLVLEVNARPGLAIQIANRQGQPVRRRTRLSGLDRATQLASWLLLAALAVAPWAFQAWQQEAAPEVRAVRAERWQAPGTAPEDASTAEWADRATTISARSEQFASARAAAAAGDTARAVRLYREAARDSTLTPFALNNLALIQRDRGDLVAARRTLETAVRAYPEYARGIYNLGLIRRDLGDRPAAEASFRASLALRPGHARSWGQLGELLLARGEADSARLALEQAIRFNPDAIGDRRQLGRALLALGRPGEAATRFAQARVLAPGSARAAVGWVDARLEHAARAPDVPALASLDSLRAAVRPHGSLAARGLAAELDWWAGEPLAALEVLATIPLDQLDTRWLTTRALLALELGLWPEVDRCLEASDSARLRRVADAVALRSGGPAARQPRDPVLALAWHLARPDTAAPPAALVGAAAGAAADAVEQAFVAAVAGRGDWAAVARPTPPRLRRAREPDATPVPASLLLAAAAPRVPAAADLLAARFPDYRPRLEAAFTAALAADPDRARALGRRLLRTEPAGAEIRLALADLELAAGAADAAREHLEALGAADRGRPDARRLEARLWLAADEPGRARRQLATLAQASPRDRRSWTLLAQAQAADGRLADAAASWRRALQLAPEDLASREQLARALMELDRYAEAARQWERLRSFELPRDLARSATFNHALALQRDDRDAEALPVWDALLAEHPDLRSATFNRALALQRLGRRAEAIAGYERVLTLDPDHEASQERLRRLRQEDTP